MIRWCLFAIACCFISGLVDMDAAQDTHPLTLSLQAHKPTYGVGDAIRLDVRLQNDGPGTVTVAAFFRLPADDPAKNNLEIEIRDHGGNRLSRVSHTMTGRAVPYPVVRTIEPGAAYREVIQLAGTFSRERNGRTVTEALWNLGENPAITHLNEYPPMASGTFAVRLVYHVDETHLVSLPQAERGAVWKGRLTSNTTQIVVR